MSIGRGIGTFVIAVAVVVGPAPAVAQAATEEVAASRAAEAQRVAAQLGEALWAFDWRTGGARTGTDVRRCVTPALWADWQASPGAPSAQARRVEQREVDRVTSMLTVVADATPQAIGIAVSARVVVTRDGRRASAGRDDAEMLVVRTSVGWRVSEVDL